MEDAGLIALSGIAEQLKIDDEWCEWSDRSFSWIAGSLRQTVEASPPFESYGLLVCRIIAAVPVVDHVPAESRSQTLLTIGMLNMHASGSALVYDEREATVWHVCGALVHEEVLQSRTQELASACICQLVQAEIAAERLPALIGGQPAGGRMSDGRERPERDEMLGIIEQFYRPIGERESAFASEEAMGEVERMVRSMPDLFTLGSSRTGIAVELPFGGNQTGLIWLKTDELHPQLGSGLGVFSVMPHVVDQATAADFANGLNFRAFDRASIRHDLGAWAVRPREDEGCHVANCSFVPSANAGIVKPINVAMAAVARMRAMAEELGR